MKDGVQALREKRTEGETSDHDMHGGRRKPARSRWIYRLFSLLILEEGKGYKASAHHTHKDTQIKIKSRAATRYRNTYPLFPEIEVKYACTTN